MKTLNRIYHISIVFVFCLLFMLPHSAMAQRFGHGGGGGFHGRGGGGFHGGGAPAARPGGFGHSINGGSFQGNRDFRGGGFFRGGRPAIGFRGPGFRGDIAYHSYGAHPYFYHPYHPYIWGPYWHPFGFFAASLTADAIFFSWQGQRYYYDDGVYYEPQGNGYTAVQPPIGAVVSYLPNGYLTIPMGDDTYYYYAGVFYLPQGNGYRIVPGPIGAIVTEIPQGASEQNINGQNYLLYNNTYYEPISQNGQDAYEVVQVN